MSPTPPTLNPSQTVERIREIIVGRHLERIEGRILRLESKVESTAPSRPQYPDQVEDRLLINEARVEALQEHVQRMEITHGEVERTATMFRQEAQRLSAQIQEVAREKSRNSAVPAVEGLERKLGVWLTNWQTSMNSRLDLRDRDLAERIWAELAALKSDIELRLSELESRTPYNLEERFSRLATAARALAESAGSFSNPFPPRG